MDDMTERPLIEVAREVGDALLRKNLCSNPTWAACYVLGYDDGRESVAAEKAELSTLRLRQAALADWHDRIASLEAQDSTLEAENASLRARLAARSDVLGVVVDDAMTLANTRIAELEAANETLRGINDHLVLRVSELDYRCDALTKNADILRERLAALEAEQPDVLGVVVTDEMVDTWCRSWYGHASRPSTGTLAGVRKALTAAFTSAQTVPLASGEPVGVCSPTGSLFSTATIGKAGYSDCSLMYRSATTQEVSRGE